MILEKFRVDGKVALVTGASRGIGLAIAHALGEAGARLVVSSRTPRPDAVAQLLDAGYAVDFIQADLEDPGAAAGLVNRAIRMAGKLDILVNNAGVALGGDSETYSYVVYRRQMMVNLDSVFLCCQAALGPMRRQGGGVILNVGSISGFISNVPQRQAAYNASKAAVHQLTRSLASDYAADNIRVNAIAPGYILTDMTKEGFADPARATPWKSLTPMGRAAEPWEVATAALFLCSPASSYVTGEVLVIDGGYTTR